MNRWIKAIALAVIVLLIISFCGFGQQCGEIRERVVRLHVLANSDSKEDQELKLKVRDAITKAAAGLFDETHNAGDALKKAEAAMPELQKIGQQCVYDAGYDYAVKAELTNMYFTTRVYDTVTLPAGMYDALRITIGSAEGKNWWCVVFPPMCVSAATDASQLSDVLNDEQMDIVTQPQKYEVRFKVVELVEGAINQIREWFATAETPEDSGSNQPDSSTSSPKIDK